MLIAVPYKWKCLRRGNFCDFAILKNSQTFLLPYFNTKDINKPYLDTGKKDTMEKRKRLESRDVPVIGVGCICYVTFQIGIHPRFFDPNKKTSYNIAEKRENACKRRFLHFP